MVVIFAALQYANTISSSKQMNSLIDAANQMKNAGWEFSGAAVGINHAGWNAVGKLNDQSTQLANNVKQSGRLADATEKANANVLEADRPWFGVAITAQDSLEVGKIPAVTVVFINSGKRPARVLISAVACDWFTVFPKNPPYKFSSGAVKSNDIVVPNSIVTSKFNLFYKPLGQAEVEMANNGPPKLFLYANIEYVDLRTQTKHFTHSCWVYVGNDPVLTKGFYNSGEYNDAD